MTTGQSKIWLPSKDLNLESVVQSHVCYRYTTGQYTC